MVFWLNSIMVVYTDPLGLGYEEGLGVLGVLRRRVRGFRVEGVFFSGRNTRKSCSLVFLIIYHILQYTPKAYYNSSKCLRPPILRAPETPESWQLRPTPCLNVPKP